MIDRSTGEVAFRDLRILPQARVPSPLVKPPRNLPIPGWFGHFLGVHESEHGVFIVEAVSHHDRIQVVLMAHSHPFYEPKTPGDNERRAFHEGVISIDLSGQREFSWGEVLCRFNSRENRDWLVVAYTPGPHVPKPSGDVLALLLAREPDPGSD